MATRPINAGPRYDVSLMMDQFQFSLSDQTTRVLLSWISWLFAEEEEEEEESGLHGISLNREVTL